MRARHGFPDRESVPLYSGGGRGDHRPYRDLCSTCIHAEACRGRSTSDNPILFCEEFEVLVGQTDGQASVVFGRTRRRASRKPIGLCLNCDNAATCTIPRPDGGIWHCQEYR